MTDQTGRDNRGGIVLGLILIAAGLLLMRDNRSGGTPVQEDEAPVPVGS